MTFPVGLGTKGLVVDVDVLTVVVGVEVVVDNDVDVGLTVLVGCAVAIVVDAAADGSSSSPAAANAINAINTATTATNGTTRRIIRGISPCRRRTRGRRAASRTGRRYAIEIEDRCHPRHAVDATAPRRKDSSDRVALRWRTEQRQRRLVDLHAKMGRSRWGDRLLPTP
jgi:hypothetical protein